jgi:hypothetical protein
VTRRLNVITASPVVVLGNTFRLVGAGRGPRA